MKIAMPMMLAWYFHQREETLRVGDYLVAGLLLLVPVALIVRQPDLGTAILVIAAGFYRDLLRRPAVEVHRSAWSPPPPPRRRSPGRCCTTTSASAS